MLLHLFLLTFSFFLGRVACAGIRPALQSVGSDSLLTSNSLSTNPTTLAPVPIFTGMSPSSGSSRGGYIVTIHGKNLLLINKPYFPPVINIFNDGCIPDYAYPNFCLIETVSVQDTAVIFLMPPGGGNGQSIIDLEYAGSSATGIYDSPTFGSALYFFTYTSDFLSITQVAPATIPQTGGIITINGTNFGILPGKVGFFCSVLHISAVPLTVISWNSTRIMCSAPVGSGIFGLRVFSASGSYSPVFHTLILL